MTYYLWIFASHIMYCTEWRSWTVYDGLTCLVPELRHIVVGQLYVGITQGLHVVYKATNASLLLQLIYQGLSRLYPSLLQNVKEGKNLEQINYDWHFSLLKFILVLSMFLIYKYMYARLLQFILMLSTSMSYACIQGERYVYVC